MVAVIGYESRMVLPITVGSPPKRPSHSRRLMTTAKVASGSGATVSCSSSVRAPSTEKKSRVTEVRLARNVRPSTLTPTGKGPSDCDPPTFCTMEESPRMAVYSASEKGSTCRSSRGCFVTNTRRSWSRTGSGRRRTAWTTANIATAEPTPTESVARQTTAYSGRLAIDRTPGVTSLNRSRSLPTFTSCHRWLVERRGNSRPAVGPGSKRLPCTVRSISGLSANRYHLLHRHHQSSLSPSPSPIRSHRRHRGGGTASAARTLASPSASSCALPPGLPSSGTLRAACPG